MGLLMGFFDRGAVNAVLSNWRLRLTCIRNGILYPTNGWMDTGRMIDELS